MRSSLILQVTLLLTIAATSIVQARTIKSSEHTCGSLGPGTNACKCNEIVVKAAKVQKPLVYASPEAINEAALVREAAGRLSLGSKSHSNVISGCSPQNSGIISTSSSSSSSSSNRYSTSSSSASSSVGLLGGLIGGYSPLNPILNGASSGSGCGCGKKSEPLETSDLLSSNTDKQIVPSFPPIGDLCYPNKLENGKLQVITKVTPAYPSKVKCTPPTSEKICVDVHNGQIDEADLKKLSLSASSSASAASGKLLGQLNGASAFASANSLGKYTLSNAGSTAQYGNFGGYGSSSSAGYSSLSGLGGYSSSGSAGYSSLGGLGGYSSSGSAGYSSLGGLGGYSSSGSAGYSSLGGLGGYSSSNSVGYGSSGKVGGYGSAGYSAYGSGYAGYGGYAGYAGSSAGTTVQLNPTISSYGTYKNKFGSLNGVEVTRGSAESYRSNCDDFSDYAELPEDYSYPQLPADPVSLSLAYRNIFPRIVAQKKLFVPEDKLAFGHRTIPTETVSNKKRLDVPEEKLQILDKPVVELKPIAVAPVIVTTYDEHEEAKLAELEAIERERIHQEEIAEQQQQQGNFITYGDLGYAPIYGALSKKLSSSQLTNSINTLGAEDNAEGCAPVGPPALDYVPGSIVINREVVKTQGELEDDIQKDVEKVYVRHYEDDERSFEDDDAEDSTSGIFARLRSSSKKYGLPCGVA
ncbi:putative GPI-anchored protein pfl2 [Nylanderia fulva]|uniref:putative GPI-anchored protein pfl2 n=1 Tax=Nylanderia fulva TaxID=613905 RepID=UPI0010FB56A0|nr:putative GPI-anchored protein pfl2 [Nylanderia fulva]